MSKTEAKSLTLFSFWRVWMIMNFILSEFSVRSFWEKNWARLLIFMKYSIFRATRLCCLVLKSGIICKHETICLWYYINNVIDVDLEKQRTKYWFLRDPAKDQSGLRLTSSNFCLCFMLDLPRIYLPDTKKTSLNRSFEWVFQWEGLHQYKQNPLTDQHNSAMPSHRHHWVNAIIQIINDSQFDLLIFPETILPTHQEVIIYSPGWQSAGHKRPFQWI